MGWHQQSRGKLVHAPPFLILLALLAPTQAIAQAACLPHGKMADMLDQRYLEQPVSAGLEASGRLLEVFATADGGTWTLVMTTPNGLACVVASGLEWQDAILKRDDT